MKVLTLLLLTLVLIIVPISCGSRNITGIDSEPTDTIPQKERISAVCAD